MGPRRIFGGGEPDYVEPITVEPDRWDLENRESYQVLVVTVISQTEWEMVKGGGGDDLSDDVDYSADSGPAGVSEVELAIWNDRLMRGYVTFRDAYGYTASVYIDTHYQADED